MRVRTKIWFGVLAVCVGLTVYEIPNATLIWQYARTARNRVMDRKDLDSYLTEGIAATDREAADILTYCLGEPNNAELADLVSEYPNNEFLLTQFAQGLSKEQLVDPRAALIIADRLVAIDPDNAHYRYLKGCILLTGAWDEGHERRAIEEFELGASLPRFSLPYARYAERIDSLCDRAGISRLYRNRWMPNETALYFNLGLFISRSRGFYRTLDTESFSRLSVAAKAVATDVIDHAQEFGHVEAGAFLLGVTETARLRGLDLSPQEAQEARYSACRAFAIEELLQRWFEESLALGGSLVLMGLAATLPLLFLPQLPLVWLLILIANLLRRRTRIAPVVAALLVAYWLLILVVVHVSSVKWSRLDRRLTNPLSLYQPLPAATRRTYEQIAFAEGPLQSPAFRAGWGDNLPPCLHVASPEDMAAFIAKRRSSGRPISDRTLLSLGRGSGRDVWPVVLGAMRDPNTLEVLIARAKSQDSPVRDDLDKTFEEKMVALMGGAPVSDADEGPGSLGDAIYARIIDLAMAGGDWPFGDEETPQRQTDRQATETGAPHSEIERLLWMTDALASVSEPNEAASRYSELLTRISGMSRRDLSLMIAQLGAFTDPSAADGDLSDGLDAEGLLRWLAASGADLLPSAAAPLEDPNGLENLVADVRSGDKTAKGRLDDILEARLSAFSEAIRRAGNSGQIYGSLLEIAGALALVDEAQAAEDRFRRLIEPAIVEDGQDNRNTTADASASTRSQATPPTWVTQNSILFYRSLAGLPRPNAARLLKEYIRLSQIDDPFDEIDLRDVLERAADRDLAEWVLRGVADAPPTAPEYDVPIGRPVHISEVQRTAVSKDVSAVYLEQVFAQLDATSFPLLLEHLETPHDELRAFVVWRLASLGHEWTSEQLQALQEDPYWKVRLNALFTYGAKGLGGAPADENNLVRTVANALSDLHRRD